MKKSIILFIRGVKKGQTTLKAETGLTQAFNWGEATCLIDVLDAPAE